MIRLLLFQFSLFGESHARLASVGWFCVWLGAMRAVVTGLALAFASSSYAAEQGDRELTRSMVGAWRSPRHDYVYLVDGTWWMGKPDPNGPEPHVTHGYWWIKDHRLCETVYLQAEGLRDNGCELITKLTKHKIVYGGYQMKRIAMSEVDHY
jgi:hypothetical protein